MFCLINIIGGMLTTNTLQKPVNADLLLGTVEHQVASDDFKAIM